MKSLEIWRWNLVSKAMSISHPLIFQYVKSLAWSGTCCSANCLLILFCAWNTSLFHSIWTTRRALTSICRLVRVFFKVILLSLEQKTESVKEQNFQVILCLCWCLFEVMDAICVLKLKSFFVRDLSLGLQVLFVAHQSDDHVFDAQFFNIVKIIFQIFKSFAVIDWVAQKDGVDPSVEVFRNVLVRRQPCWVPDLQFYGLIALLCTDRTNIAAYCSIMLLDELFLRDSLEDARLANFSVSN